MSARPLVALGWPKTDYCLSLEAAGSVPRVLKPDRDVPHIVLGHVDGLLLTGGADVDPTCYGETERHPTVSIVDGRDAYELALSREAFARGLPTLAICRGLQLMNVAAGGTLVQDLPSQRPSGVTHRLKEPETGKAHTVDVKPHTRLAAILTGASRQPLTVNSRHHQAVDRLADDFVVSAVAPDGVIEAIEHRDRPFCIAVQWHPENYWATGEFAALFVQFVEAARTYAATRATSE
jgi:putative glutamine amidotransferase